MKIGIFSECYLPIMNGVAVSIDTFRKGLEKEGHEVFIFTPDNDGAGSDNHVIRFPAVENISKKLYPITFPSLEIMKTYLPDEIVKDLDIVHAQHMFTMGRLARYAAREYKKPLVYTYHTLITEYANKYSSIFAPIIRAYLRNMSKRFCNSCDQVITPSPSMKRILIDFGVKKPIEPIPTGIEPKNFKRQDSKQFRTKHKIDSKDKILLYLSRIAKEKNIPFLFKAFKKIQKEYPDCHLLMVGGGPEEKEMQYLAKELKIKKITFTGMVPKEEANRIFGMADIFTFPSYTETQGIVVAEAMAAGTPPVAVGKMGPTDLIQDGKDGYLTKMNVNDFSQKILKLLKDDGLRQKFAKAGLARIEEFSTNTSVEKMIKLYKKVINKDKSELEKI